MDELVKSLFFAVVDFDRGQDFGGGLEGHRDQQGLPGGHEEIEGLDLLVLGALHNVTLPPPNNIEKNNMLTMVSG